MRLPNPKTPQKWQPAETCSRSSTDSCCISIIDTKLPFRAQMTCSARFAGQLILALPCITLLIPHPPHILDVVRLPLILILYIFLRKSYEHLLIAGEVKDWNMGKKKTKQRKSNEEPRGLLIPEVSTKIDYHRPLSSWVVWISHNQRFLTYSLALRVPSCYLHYREQTIWHSRPFPSELPKAHHFLSWVIDYHHA